MFFIDNLKSIKIHTFLLVFLKYMVKFHILRVYTKKFKIFDKKHALEVE